MEQNQSVYAICLYFDDATTERISNIIDKVAQESYNTYMVENRITPHVTVSMVICDDEEMLLKEIENYILTISKADIYFDQIACFGTKVVYLSPRKDEFLTDVNIQVNRILSNHFEIADNGNYLPEEWIPHCALAVQLDEKQFENALKIAQTENLEMTGKVIKLAVVKCNPYRDVKIFDID